MQARQELVSECRSLWQVASLPAEGGWLPEMCVKDFAARRAIYSRSGSRHGVVAIRGINAFSYVNTKC